MSLIPPITDELGKGWWQPDHNKFLFDDTHVIMTKSEFLKLATYSTTFPSGVYSGKMWKRHNGAYDQGFLIKGGIPKWVLVWYGDATKPEVCSINIRDIILIDGELPKC